MARQLKQTNAERRRLSASANKTTSLGANAQANTQLCRTTLSHDQGPNAPKLLANNTVSQRGFLSCEIEKKEQQTNSQLMQKITKIKSQVGT